MMRPKYITTTRIGDVSHYREIVRDEQICQPISALQFLEQVHDLALNRHVERRHRLVADDERRLHRERTRDADALALAAGELVRVALRHFRPQSDLAQQLLHAVARFLALGNEVIDVLAARR